MAISPMMEIEVVTDADGDFTAQTENLNSRYLARAQVVMPASNRVDTSSVFTITDTESGYEILTNTLNTGKMFHAPYPAARKENGTAYNNVAAPWQTTYSLTFTISGGGNAKECTIRYWLTTNDSTLKDI